VGVEVVALLLRQLDVLERRGDLVKGQKPLLHAFQDEPLQFPGVRTTLSGPEPSAEKPCVLYAFDLPLRDGEPRVRGLQHRQKRLLVPPRRYGLTVAASTSALATTRPADVTPGVG